MKLLFIIPHNFIPPNSGNKNLLFALLKGLSTHVECDLAILAESVEPEVKSRIQIEFPYVKEIYIFQRPLGICLQISRLKFLLGGFHHALGRYRSVAMENWLTINADRYDLIHFDMVHVAPYRVFCGAAPTLLVASDAYSLAARTARLTGTLGMFSAGYALLQEWWFGNFERQYYPRFDIVCTVSDIDARWLASIAPKATIRTIGIGLAVEYADRQIKHFSAADISKKRILCTGNLNHSAIAEGTMNFLYNSLPVLLRKHPDLSVTLLGKDPTPKLKACIEKLSGVVKHIDFVENYADFLDDDWVYVYPQDCGTGLQTKIQQAMALGLPVVAFAGSFGGLGVESGKHCLICNDTSDMSQNVMSLIDSVDLRRRIGLAASTYIRERFSIEHTGDEMLSHYHYINNKAISKHGMEK